MKLFAMVGYKLYKEEEDGHVHMIRIVHVKKPFKLTESTKEPSEITIFDYDDNDTLDGLFYIYNEQIHPIILNEDIMMVVKTILYNLKLCCGYHAYSFIVSSSSCGLRTSFTDLCFELFFELIRTITDKIKENEHVALCCFAH